MSGWLSTLTAAGVIGTGLMAGLFFMFSVCIMPALARLESASGMKAMQTINVAIGTPLFGLVFIGAAATAAALAGSAIWTWDEPGAGYRLAGGLVYLGGALIVTLAYHIPRNIALARADADGAGAAETWATFLREWVPMNHVRAVASATSLVLLVLALGAD